MTVNTEGIQILDLPLPPPSLITLLSQHLPHALPVLRRLQYAANFPNNGLGTTLYSHCLFASKHSLEAFSQSPADGTNGQSGGSGRRHFAAAFVDLGRFPETQVWVYSTLEDYGVFDPDTGAGKGSFSALGEASGGFGAQSHSLPEEEARECDQLLLALLRRMKSIALQMPVQLEDVSEQRQANWKEAREYLLMDPAKTSNGTTTNNGNNKAEGPKVMIGSLAEVHRHRLFLDKNNGYGVQMHKTSNIPDDIDWEVCQKWLFRTDSLLFSPTQQEKLDRVMKQDGLVWDRVRNAKDARLVQSRTAIQRQEDTLLGLPSVAIRETKGGEGEGGQMVAWGFMALDGTLMTLHVEEEYRGKGLAKAVACKVMRDHIRDYGDDGWGAADVFVANVRSQGVCRSIGGRVGWLLSWAVVDLATVGDAL